MSNKFGIFSEMPGLCALTCL